MEKKKQEIKEIKKEVSSEQVQALSAKNFERKKEKLEKIEEIKELKKEDEEEEFEDEILGDEFEGRDFHFGSPSLQRINISPAIVANLERDLKDVPVSSSSQEEEFKYSAGAGNKDEPKYTNYTNADFSGVVNKAEMGNIGKQNERREVGFVNSSETMSERTDMERYEKARRTDAETLGIERERREVKYKSMR